MRRVVLESPYAGNVEMNVTYARECLKDSLSRGEAPFASHLLYTQVLDDTDPEQRHKGMCTGWNWIPFSECLVVYIDLGISEGMQQGISYARDMHVDIEFRKLKK